MQITGDDEASAEIEQFIVQLEKELADYKKHFEPQMIQIRLRDQAEGEQRKTYSVHNSE